MKLPSEACLTAVLLATLSVSARAQHGEARHRKRQAPSQALAADAPQDSQSDATLVQHAPVPAPGAHAHAQHAAPAAAALADVHAHSKFFQYAHVPKKDHYEIGHRKGSDHHFTERHEKAHPESGEFKTKVRWGDKNGGYGEHYWDYNHAGHGGDSHDQPSDNVHEYEEYEGEGSRSKRDSRRHAAADAQARASTPRASTQIIVAEVENRAPTETRKRAAKYRATDTEVVRHDHSHGLRKDVPKKQTDLYLDETTGHIVDKSTGQNFMLQPV